MSTLGDTPAFGTGRSATSGLTAWFGVLWLAWAAALGGAIAVGNLGGGHGSAGATWLRMISEDRTNISRRYSMSK